MSVHNSFYLSRKSTPGATPWRFKNIGDPNEATPYWRIVGPDVDCPDRLTKFFLGPGQGFSNELTITCTKTAETCCDRIEVTFSSAYSGTYTMTGNDFGDENWPVYQYDEDQSVLLIHKVSSGGATPWHIKRSNQVLEYLGPEVHCPNDLNTTFEGNGIYSNIIQVSCVQ